MTIIAPSVLGADLLRLGEEIELVERLGLKWLHLDHMDGHFTPNISFGPDFVRAIRKKTELFLDVHLMFTNPMEYIDTYTKMGADSITVHVEAEDDPLVMIHKIHANGLKAGISLNPHTPPDRIRHLLEYVDMVLVMTVEPGFGGQKLREYCLGKVSVIRDMIQKTGRDILIEVDGGIKVENAQRVIEAGADVLVMGTGVFAAKDPKAVIDAVCGTEAGA
ncbi:MAG: ribulose-phosphate 3-epimerase [Clostridia bacterium]|nr:ribulose-phosphate 3-epimerase [Clostridia bacterium]